jgi:predicted Zn-dependent protease
LQRKSDAVQVPMSRRQKLEEFVEKNPGDAFARYGLAMECVNNGETGAAEEHFRALLKANPDYVAGYYHFGQLLARLKRNDEAREVLSNGVAVAQRAGNPHAAEEMRAALAEIG